MTGLYSSDIFTIKRYGDHTVKITHHASLRNSGYELDCDITKGKRGTVNSEKLENNLCRAKSKVREYVLCNPWDWWCTFTISPEKYDRYDLNAFKKDFAEFLHGYNKRCSEEDKVKYLLVPEQCADGAWHMHGFLKGIREKDLYKNQYGYMTWKQYEKKFGFISMDRIHDIDKASSYILKYMTKDMKHTEIELNAQCYYCSQGLNTAEEIYRGHGTFYGEYDWKHPDGYVQVKTINENETDISEVFSMGY